MPGLMPEVMDKMPSVPGIRPGTLVLGGTAFWLCLRRPRLALPIVPLRLFPGWGLHAEIQDPFAGPAILREAGRGYFVQAYVSIALHLLLPLAGAAAGAWRSSRPAAPRPASPASA